MFFHERAEFGARKMLEKLIEEAGSLYDCLGPPCGRRSAKLRPRNDSPTFNYRRAPFSKPVLDNSDLDWVLFTDHHREHVQGYPRLSHYSPRIAVPAGEAAICQFSLKHSGPNPFYAED